MADKPKSKPPEMNALYEAAKQASSLCYQLDLVVEQLQQLRGRLACTATKLNIALELMDRQGDPIDDAAE